MSALITASSQTLGQGNNRTFSHVLKTIISITWLVALHYSPEILD